MEKTYKTSLPHSPITYTQQAKWLKPHKKAFKMASLLSLPLNNEKPHKKNKLEVR